MPSDADNLREEGGVATGAPERRDPREVGAPGGEGPRYAGAGPEEQVWRGGPSQWTNFPVFVLCALLSPLILPVLYAAWMLIETRSESFTLTTERLRTERGVLSKKRDELELYRVRDIETRQSLLQRLVGVGTIVLMTSDRSDPTLTLPSVRGHRFAADLIRKHTETMRRLKRVRDLDVD